MSNDSASGGGAIKPQPSQAVRFDPLTPSANAAVFSSLSKEQQDVLLMEYMRGNLDVGKKAAQMHVDVDAFRSALEVMSAKTREVSSQEGVSVQFQHTQESSFGKTEAIMGNTAQAASGKLTRTMANERNLTPFYYIGGIIGLLILVSLFMHH